MLLLVVNIINRSNKGLLKIISYRFKTENMFKTIAKDIFHKDTFMWNGNEINIAGEWKKVSMTDAIKEKTGIDFRTITVEEALKLAEEHKIEVAEHEKTLGHIINLFFEKYVEET